jgi:hypothetical protein
MNAKRLQTFPIRYLAGLILKLYTASKPARAKSDPTPNPKLWQKTPFANLVRYTPGGMYFCRIRVHGQLFRKSLKTDVLSVAKLRLTDEEKKDRQAAARQLALQRGRGQMTFGEALAIYRARLAANPDIKSRSIRWASPFGLATSNQRGDFDLKLEEAQGFLFAPPQR